MEYMTLAEPVHAELIEKRSRFIADLSPVQNEEEALRFIGGVKAAHPDARHHIYAFLLRDGSRRCSDDGEPQGTAGVPVLEVLSRKGLLNVAAVVTRYFGGILLGAPGLLRAYTGSVTLAIGQAKIRVMRRRAVLRAELEYSLLGGAERLVAQFGGRISDAQYQQNVVLQVILPFEQIEAFQNAFVNLSNGCVHPELTDELFCE